MKRILIFALGLLVGLLVLLTFVAYRMGVFNSVALSRETRGPYLVACLPHTGAYARISEKILRVEQLLREAGVTPVGRCAIYLDNPKEVPEEKLRSKGGFVIESAVSLPQPLELVNVPKREVLHARFEGHRSVAPAKINPAMSEWMQKNGFQPAWPAIEFYAEGVVECEIPIQPVPKQPPSLVLFSSVFSSPLALSSHDPSDMISAVLGAGSSAQPGAD